MTKHERLKCITFCYHAGFDRHDIVYFTTDCYNYLNNKELLSSEIRLSK